MRRKIKNMENSLIQRLNKNNIKYWIPYSLPCPNIYILKLESDRDVSWKRWFLSVQLLIPADIVKVAQSAPKLHGCGSMQWLAQESFGSLPNQRLPADPFFPKHSEIPISPCYRHVYLTPPHHLLGCVTFSTSCLWLGCNLEGMMWWRKIKCDASVLMDQLPSLTILHTYESSRKELHNIMVCCKKPAGFEM